MRKVLLTGSTGLIGSFLLKYILEKSNAEVYLIVRGDKAYSPKERVVAILKDYFKLTNYEEYLKRIVILGGDLTDEATYSNDNQVISSIINGVDTIFHSAALAEFRQPLELVRKVNVEGTKKLLNFISKFKKVRQVNYVGTAFIAGNHKGEFTENDFDLKQGFNNTYEQSKFECEQMIRLNFSHLPIVFFRPSIIVGALNDGKTNNFRMFYQPFRTLSKKLLSKIPINRATLLNVLPCDVAADMIFKISNNAKIGSVYHIISDQPINIMHLMGFASRFFNYSEPNYVSLVNFDINELTPVQRKLIEPYIPYFTFNATFKAENTFNLLFVENYTMPPISDSFLTTMFGYAEKLKYIKKVN